MDRRRFLSQTGLTGGAFLLSGFLQRAQIVGQDRRNGISEGYGEITAKASKNTGEVCIALPKGFEYNVLGAVGSLLSDSEKTPAAHDGMGSFLTQGQLRIVRNHEINDKVGKEGVVIGSKNHYDESAGGGTTTLILNPKTKEVERSFISLSGTLNNCAGGITPWGSWISCEETILGQKKIVTKDGQEEGGFLKPHGYCFEVDASANSVVQPIPLKAMGRFAHEAVSFDRKRGIVYLTEDSKPAGFYRFLPNRQKRLAEGGVLQILAVKNSTNYDTRKNQQIGKPLPATWKTITNPDPPEADIEPLAVFNQGADQGAAIFTRLEGCFATARGEMYFVSTDGGENGGGQIWFYQAINNDEGRLTLVYESPDRNLLDMPDNICLHPKNKLIFLCEDSDYAASGGTLDNSIRILTPDGRISEFAKNVMPGFERSEFAGSVFDPNGKILFVNIQTAGVTLAIWGDWNSFQA